MTLVPIAMSFQPTTGELSFIEIPDYEVKASYSDVVLVTDGSLQTSQSINVDLNETLFEVYGSAYASE